MCPCPRHENIEGSRGAEPFILNLRVSQQHASAGLVARRRTRRKKRKKKVATE
jgi:hypothetical protein